MAGFDGSSPALIEHTRAAIQLYLKKIEDDISAAYDVLAEATESQGGNDAATARVNELIFKLDEAKTAFARLPFTVAPRAEFL